MTYATPADTRRPGWESSTTPDFDVVFFNGASDLNASVADMRPDVIVAVNWELVDGLSEQVDIPLVLDLIAPRLLEMPFQQMTHSAIDAEILRYMTVLGRGSRFLCSTDKQKAFCRSWLMLSGIHATNDGDPIDVIPISADPRLPKRERKTSKTVTFVYGGVFWPWQRPTPYLNRVLTTLRRTGSGQLLVIGGTYPLAPGALAQSEVTDHLAPGRHLTVKPLLPYDEMEAQFLNAHVALDLAERNAERELSFSYRMIEYLRCGLPVICNHYLSIAADIESYRAGWVIDTDNAPDTLEALVEEILAHPDGIAERSANAQRLIADRYNWARTTEPLYQYCIAPTMRRRRPNVLTVITAAQRDIDDTLRDQARTLAQHFEQLSRQSEHLSRQSEHLSRQSEHLSRHTEELLRHTEALAQQRDRLQRHETHIAALGEQLDRMERASEARHADIVGQLQHLHTAQQHLEHRVSTLGIRGMLRWVWRIPERIYRVILKPLVAGRETKNIAIITRADLFPVHHGAAVRIVESARALSRHCDQVLLITNDRFKYFSCIGGRVHEQYYPKFLRMFPIPMNPLLQYILQRRGLPPKECYLFYALYDLNMWARTLFLAYQHPIALYQAEFPAFLRPARIARWCFGGTTALVEHNVEFARIDETEGMPSKGRQFLRRVEVRLCNRADYVIAVSTVDRDALIEAGVNPGKIAVIPHGVDLERFTEAEPEDSPAHNASSSRAPVLVYHGPYSYAPNLKAAMTLGTVILPALERYGHQAVCLAIGDSPPAHSPHPSLTFVGPVDDIASHLKRGDIAAIPLTAGGGTRMKILDYFAARIPVVATSKAVEGLPVEDGRHLVIVDEVEEMAEPIAVLIENPDLRRELADNAFTLVEALDWSVIGTQYMKLYNLPWWRENGETGAGIERERERNTSR